MYKITKDLMPIYMRSNMDYKYGLQILVYNFYNPHKIEVKKNDMSNIYRERETCIHKIKCRELPEVEMKVDL